VAVVGTPKPVVGSAFDSIVVTRLNKQAGLGRSFAWNQFAVENGIVDVEGNFIGDREHCGRMAEEMRRHHNALDRRAA